MAAKPKQLITVVGPTASGKSALALQLAQKFDGEIICADSRTIYKGMDIGTSKPSLSDQQLAVHHLLDIVLPDQTFTAAEFKKLATEAIDDILGRHKLPIIVGGTGLYVDSILYDFEFREKPDPARRAELEKLSVEELQSELQAEGIQLPENDKNPRHLIRALETGGALANGGSMREDTLVVGLEVDNDVLKGRIKERVEHMLNMGLRREVSDLVNHYGWEVPGMNAIGYKEWKVLFSGETLAESKVVDLIIKNTWQYARRQKTWFKRNNEIQWQKDIDSAISTVEKWLKAPLKKVTT